MTNNTLGIDFGTSNSAAGVLVNGKPHLIEIEQGQKTLPTSIFFDFDTQKTLIGSPANASLIRGEEGRFMRALKSVLGTSLMNEQRRIIGQTLSFYDIIALFLKQLKSRAEEACYQEFDYALSGRPVLFHSNDATKDAKALADLTRCYELAGFKGVDFLYEPEAAAIANGALETDENIGLIVDIGGGTSDFTVFKSKGQTIDIMASHGVRIGGTNFDKSISVDHVMPLLGKGTDIRNEMGSGTLPAPNAIFQDLATWEKIPFMYSQDTRKSVAKMHKMAVEKPLFARLESVLEHELAHEMAFAVETGKIQVNKADQDRSKIDLSMIQPDLAAILTQSDLDISLAIHAQGIKECALETVKRAECNPSQINTVIFVGGSSLMSVVGQTMADIFPQAKQQYSDAFTAVVDGLAIAAAEG
ncbi:Hsp70 family protein [Amylibacter sp. SFDW26]|uniref:Hsp70 family protein n=1 Tax=Amylibacter sp. SFDW26 TaxID=2652722 RepID=UPI001261D899|nr:Hsp70 family protein [Amylibacter sp. SFDW26]KAB7615783.1 Hsp70 family protein [Amylibacter sp. SFDW26]